MLPALSRRFLRPVGRWWRRWREGRHFHPRACVACRRDLPAETWGAALHTHPGGPGAPGDVTVCPSCGAALVFVDPDRLRRFQWRRDPRIYGAAVVAQIFQRQRELADRNSGTIRSPGFRSASTRQVRRLNPSTWLVVGRGVPLT